MQLLILGVGDAFTAEHFGSSGLVRTADGRFVMIDCPDPIHRVLREAAARAGWDADASSIHDVIITHIHGDHCNGLESFGFKRGVWRMEGRDLPLPRLHTTAAVRDRLWEKLAPAMDGTFSPNGPHRLEDFFELHLLDPDREARIAGLTVRCRFTQHSVPTIGLLISDGERTIGWSGDTAFEQAHIDWLSQAELIVHESNVGPTHTPIEKLAALPESLRRKINLIHLPDDFDPSTVTMRVLREGDVL